MSKPTVTVYDSEPGKGGGEFTRAEMTCCDCGTVFEITHVTAQAVHLATGLCKACIVDAKRRFDAATRSGV